MFAETKLRRGMIFTRIRVGDVKPWPMGENPCVTFPCFIQPPPLKIVVVSWGSYGWEWSVAGLSVLAHTHTPPAWLTSRWQANHHHHSSRQYTLLTTMLKHSCTGFSWFYSRSFSSTDFVDGAGVYFPHKLIRGLL